MLQRTEAATTKSRRKPEPVESAVFWLLPAVCSFAQISRSTLLRKVAAHEVPQPVKLGESSTSPLGFVAAEVREWAAARIAKRDEVAA